MERYELADHWSLRPEEKELLGNKQGPSRLGFAVMLKFFQQEGRFPRQRQDVPLAIVKYLRTASRGCEAAWNAFAWQGRTIEYYRAQIRDFLGFREATVEDADAIGDWLVEHILPRNQNLGHISSEIATRCRSLHIEPPAPERLDRLIRCARPLREPILQRHHEALSRSNLRQLEALLLPDATGDGDRSSAPEQVR